VRRAPAAVVRSRSTTALPRTLRPAGTRYTHIPELGGLRHARKDSPGTGWRNAGFRGYAGYMQTAPFRTSLDRCIDLAKASHVVLMCAEAVRGAAIARSLRMPLSSEGSQ
jgi:uncharacterized protein (DUF488 family)